MSGETKPEKVARAKKVIKLLKRYYPDAKCSLNHDTPFQLLIATMLSAQCTDARVNMTTPALFAKYKTPQDFAKANITELESLIRSTGFYKNKAKNIKACAQALVEKHNGKIPDNMEDLHALAGVGRKTANVVLGVAFGVPSMVVDTHVTRLSYRLGFTKTEENAVKIESELMEIIDKKDWTILSHLLIDHGRAICVARSPKCNKCFLLDECPRRGVKK